MGVRVQEYHALNGFGYLAPLFWIFGHLDPEGLLTSPGGREVFPDIMNWDAPNYVGLYRCV